MALDLLLLAQSKVGVSIARPRKNAACNPEWLAGIIAPALDAPAV